MFKSPITKTGDVRYIEVIKYTLLIALFSYGFVNFANSNFVSSILNGVSILFVLTIFFAVEALLVSTVQLIKLLKLIVKPVISYIRRNFDLSIEDAFINICINDKEIHLDNKIYNKICVIRC